MGLFSSDTQTATASGDGGGSGGGGGFFGRMITDFFKAHPDVLNGQQSGATSEESPGNATNKRKGGSVKGWGQARGARKAKTY